MDTKNEPDIEIPDEEDFEGIEDVADLKAKLESVQKKHREAGIRNRERTKMLKDTLVQRDAKIAEFLASEKKEIKPDEKLLKNLNSALMRSYGYTETDEIAIVEKWQTDTGKDIVELHTHPTLSKVLKAEVDELRTTKANAAATKNLSGGAGAGGTQKDPSHYLERGELPATKSDREKLIKAMVEKESGLMM